MEKQFKELVTFFAEDPKSCSTEDMFGTIYTFSEACKVSLETFIYLPDQTPDLRKCLVFKELLNGLCKISSKGPLK